MSTVIQRKVGKITLFAIFMISVMAGSGGLFFSEYQARIMNDQMDNLGGALIANLAAHCEYPLLIGDNDLVVRLVKGTLAQKNVVSCRVSDSYGRIIYEESLQREGAVREFTAPVISRTRKDLTGEDVIFGLPQGKAENIGSISMKISLSEFEERLLRMKLTIAGVSIAAILFAALFAHLLLRKLLGRPVSDLVTATERVAEGDLGYEVPVKRGNELGALAVSFNKMTKSLLDAREELVRKEKLAVLGQLAGIVSHELRNPLGVINNAVYFLQTIASPSDVVLREYLDIIKAEVDNSQRIISDLLDFSKTKTPQRRRVPASEVITEALKRCPVPEGVRTEVEISDGAMMMEVDPLQMGQVFQNLIMNAYQAMPKGGLLTITAGRCPDGSCVRFQVKDTGHGIARENLKKLFQPLFTTKARGTGLGLVVCRRLTETNGGRIEVESELGVGTTFTVTVPAAEEMPSAMERRQA